ncbi:MAG: glycosyltransferase 87 family protein [Candidatus Dormibacteraeota bacterium]|nr:glycosyltransferase 87 family protein [Candidatus Dormibacteraeota bacterium]
MALSSLARRPAWARISTHSLGRADLAVLGFCALGAGNVFARRGAGNTVVAPSPPQFVLGVALVVLACVFCYMAIGRPSTLPGAAICTVAIALQTCLQPAFLLPPPAVYAVGLVIAAVPLVRSGRFAWPLIAAGAVSNAWAVAAAWTWGSAPIDVFAEVQGATAAFLSGHNPYSPVFKVFLDQQNGHVTFGTGSFCYGPMVVLLSIPARLLGDVRLTVVALNLAILAAVLVWARRAGHDGRMTRMLTALWLASPFVPFMVLTEWTDSFCVAGMAWWLVLRERHRAWATVALTMGIASKPSVLLVMVPLLFWMREVRREVIWSAAATAVIVAPFALWTGLPQFVYDTVGVFADLPIRHDGVTVDGVASIVGHAFVPGGLLVVGIAVSLAAFTLRRPRDYGSLTASGAGLLIAVCLFGKQAFLNYYYIAGMVLLFTIASGAMVPCDALASPLDRLSVLGRRLAGVLVQRPSVQRAAGSKPAES